jgi:hypothetical protein
MADLSLDINLLVLNAVIDLEKGKLLTCQWQFSKLPCCGRAGKKNVDNSYLHI